MGDALQRKAYLRYLSTNIRKWTPKRGKRFIEEDPVIGGVEGLARSIMIVTSRNRQRVLQQAWDYWTGKSGKFEFKRMYLFSASILFPIEWCIGQLWSSSIMSYNIISITHNHPTNI